MNDNSPGVDVIARVLNISRQRFFQLRKEAGFPKKKPDGSYALNEVTLWYVRHLQNEIARRGDVFESGALRAARLSLLRGQAERVDMENRVVRGELLEAGQVETELVRKLVNCKSKLRGIPTTLGPQLTNKGEAYCRERLADHIDEALAELDGSIRGTEH